MKIHPQTIFNGKNAEFIVLPVAEYKRLIRAVENIEDIQEIEQYNQDKGETFPIEVVTALANGENSIKVFRLHRGLTQLDLANKVKVTKQYICQLELGERSGTMRVLRAIAKALRVDLEDLIDEN